MNGQPENKNKGNLVLLAEDSLPNEVELKHTVEAARNSIPVITI